MSACQKNQKGMSQKNITPNLKKQFVVKLLCSVRILFYNRVRTFFRYNPANFDTKAVF